MTLTWHNKILCKHAPIFPSPLRMCIVGTPGSGKTKLLLKLLLQEKMLDYNKLVLVSPTLAQKEYEVLIKCLEQGLTKNQILTLFENEKDVKDIDVALKSIKERMKDVKSDHKPIEIITYNTISDLPPPEEIVKGASKKPVKCLVCIDDSTLERDMIKVGKMFTYLRPLDGNIIFLVHKYTKIQPIIREATNMWILFRQSLKVVKDYIYKEIASSDFDSAEEMYKFCNEAWNSKHDFISLNIDTHEFSANFKKVINRGLGMDKDTYLTEQEKAFKAKLENIKIVTQNQAYQKGFDKLMERTFTPITSEQKKLTDAALLSGENTKLAMNDVKQALRESSTNVIKALTHSETVSSGLENKLKEFLLDHPKRDILFGISPASTGDYYIFDFDNILGLMNHRLQFIFPDNIVIASSEEGATSDIPVTEELLAMLTRDVVSIDANVREQYWKIIRATMYRILKEIFIRGRGGISNDIRNMREACREISKFNEIIEPALQKSKQGKGYRDFAKEPIIIPSNANDKLKRVFILLGSVMAGNNSNKILPELTALMDELRKENIIDKAMYKTIYWKAKNKLITNNK